MFRYLSFLALFTNHFSSICYDFRHKMPTKSGFFCIPNPMLSCSQDFQYMLDEFTCEDCGKGRQGFFTKTQKRTCLHDILCNLVKQTPGGRLLTRRVVLTQRYVAQMFKQIKDCQLYKQTVISLTFNSLLIFCCEIYF